MTAETAEPIKPPRPATVELAAAIFIVGGIVGLLQVGATAGGVPAGIEPFVAAALALHAGSIALGLLVRIGRAWLLALNYAAVLGFLDLQGAGASPLFLMLGLADVLIVGILLAKKTWFDAMRSWRMAMVNAARGAPGQPLTPPTARPPTR